MKMITYYKGKPITEMTKDELIDALTFAAQEIERLMNKNEHDREYMFDVFIKPTWRHL